MKIKVAILNDELNKVYVTEMNDIIRFEMSNEPSKTPVKFSAEKLKEEIGIDACENGLRFVKRTCETYTNGSNTYEIYACTMDANGMRDIDDVCYKMSEAARNILVESAIVLIKKGDAKLTDRSAYLFKSNIPDSWKVAV